MSISGIGTTGYPVAGYETKRAKERNAGSRAEEFMETVAEKAAGDKVDYDDRAFGYVAPNAPEEVKQAWMEAAKETGANGLGMSSNNGMLTHISQMMVQQLMDLYHGKSNSQDILGSTVQSALGAVKKALYNLENPLEPDIRKSLEVQQQIMKEKEFYKAFIGRLEQLQDLR